MGDTSFYKCRLKRLLGTFERWPEGGCSWSSLALSVAGQSWPEQGEFADEDDHIEHSTMVQTPQNANIMDL
jgi:hypothetical protein